MISDKSVSIVVPSLNGRHKLPFLIEALENQTYSKFETIIVLDGSTDNSETLLKNNNWKIDIITIVQENKGRSAARNSGVNIAKGEIIIFYDDDMEPEAESISKHVCLLSDHLDSKIVTGSAVSHVKNNNELSLFMEYTHSNWFKDSPDYHYNLTKQNLFLTAANLSISKSLFLKLQGFDENIKDCEDLDLAIRAYYMGITLIHDPSNKATHFGFESFRLYLLRRREYINAYNLLLKYREKSPYSKLYNEKYIRKSKLKSAIYYLLPVSIITHVDNGAFSIFPLTLRMKMYDRIISAFSVYYPLKAI